MSRKKTVNGKRVLLATRVSEPVHAAVQQVCGDMDTSAWLREVVSDALDAAGIAVEIVPEPVPVKPARKRAPSRAAPARVKAPVKKRAPSRVGADGILTPPPRPKVPPRPARPPGAGIFQEPGGPPVETPIPPAPAVNRTRCTHPGVRSVGSNLGTCPGCGHRVESGGLWAPECDAGTCGHGG